MITVTRWRKLAEYHPSYKPTDDNGINTKVGENDDNDDSKGNTRSRREDKKGKLINIIEKGDNDAIEKEKTVQEEKRIMLS